MEIRVDFLANHPGTLPVLAEWLFQEWGHRSPDGSPEGMALTLQARMHTDRIPMALVALNEAAPLGTVSLKVREVEIRPQYEHWLGALYVARPYRRMGVGSALVQALEREALELGVDQLYLYTRQPATQRLYETLGWREIERPTYRGRPAVILVKEISR